MFNYWTLDIDENDDHEGDANVVDLDAYVCGDDAEHDGEYDGEHDGGNDVEHNGDVVHDGGSHLHRVDLVLDGYHVTFHFTHISLARLNTGENNG